MAKKENKWIWPTVRVSLPIVIPLGGLVFIILAIRNQWMDVHSARYLLSAIVQALAALLAIIFAGVAILWGQESQRISYLESHQSCIEKILFQEKSFLYTLKDNIKERLNSNEHEFWKTVTKLQKITVNQFRKAFTSLLMFIVMKESKDAELPTSTSVEQFVGDETAIKVGCHPKDIEDIRTAYELRQNSVRFFEAAYALIILRVFYMLNRPKDNQHLTKAVDTLTRISQQLYDLGVKPTLRLIHRARRARGKLFIFLISLYAITIAGGMVLLSVLKKGIWDIQATWIAAVPLFLAICAVALTFYYLARIVSGEKDE